MKKFNYTLNVVGEPKKEVTRKDIIKLWGSAFVRRMQRRAEYFGGNKTLRIYLGKTYEIGVFLVGACHIYPASKAKGLSHLYDNIRVV